MPTAEAHIPDTEREDALRLGRALEVLRTRANLTTAEAGQRFGGITGEGWRKYERGEASSIFRPSVQRRLAEALGQSAQALADECVRVAEVADYPGLPEARP